MAIKTLFTMLDPITWIFILVTIGYFLKSRYELSKVKNIGTELEKYVKILEKVKVRVLDNNEDAKTLEEKYNFYINTLENEKKFEQLNSQIKENNDVLKYRNYSRVKAEDYFN